MNKLTTLLSLTMSTSVLASDTRQELDCLTEAIYFESRSESYAGQLAVALVVSNRVQDNRWPDTYCDVVHQKHQFSYYWDGKPERYLDKKAKRKAEQTANLVFFGTMIDFTEGALYYHQIDIRPDWDYNKIIPVGVIDDHVFYRDK